MKKFSAILFALIFAFSLSACNSQPAGNGAESGKESGEESGNESFGGEGSVTEIPPIDLSNMDFKFSNRDVRESFDEADAITPTDNETEFEITKEGTYIFSGTVEKPITVNAPDDAKIQIVLDGVNIENPQGPAILIESADKVFITLADGTENTLSDGSGYSLEIDGSEVDGAVFSKADLTVNGSGTLKINGNNKHAIVSKDDLVIYSATLEINAKNVALNGKDCVKIGNAEITLTAGSDGIRSNNNEDAERGFVYIENSVLNITAANDGMQAETAVKIQSGDINIVSGGGSAGGLSSRSESYKGIKSGSSTVISDGSFNISSKDDCIHSNGSIEIESGAFELSSGDDAIHADGALTLNGGTVNVLKSYEGFEGSKITVNGGSIDITASDDGLNAAGGNDSSAMGARPGAGGFMSTFGEIIITGGYIVVDASGDGIDSNGSFTLSGGVVLVSGPTNNGNGAFDYASRATVQGGILIATGSSGMAQNFSQSESQGAVLVNFATQSGGTSISVCNGDGVVLASFTPKKSYQSAVITAPDIKVGETYQITVGAVVESSDKNGFAESSSCSGGTVVSTVTLTRPIYGGGGFGGGDHGGGPGGGRPQDGFGGGNPQGGFGGTTPPDNTSFPEVGMAPPNGNMGGMMPPEESRIP